MRLDEAQQVCVGVGVRVCARMYTLAQINAVSVLDVCMKLINHMPGNCVDVPLCVLRCGLTTRRAGAI